MSFFSKRKKVGLKEVTKLYEQAREQFGPDIDVKSQEWAKFMLNGMAAILDLPVTYKEEGEKLVAELGDRKVAVETATAELIKDLVAQITALNEQKVAEELNGKAAAGALGKRSIYVKAVLAYFA